MQIPLPHKSSLYFLLALFMVAAVVLATGTLHAQTPVPAQELPYDEAEAYSIDRSLMCPVCPAETIAQAQVEISRQMRVVVREMLAEGSSRDEILDFFVARYDTDILAAPPKSGVNLLVWVLPIVGVLAALAGVWLIIRSMASHNNRPAPANGPSMSADQELAPYLEAVDHDLGLSPQPSEEISPARGASEGGVAGVEPAGGPEVSRLS